MGLPTFAAEWSAAMGSTNHPSAVCFQQLAYVLRAPAWIAHVVQAIEHGDEIEVTVSDVLGATAREVHPIAKAMCFSGCIGLFDRWRMKVVTDE